jgi:hypothetical protein
MTVRVRALRPFRGNEGRVHPGQELDVSEIRASELERVGLVVPVVGAKMRRPHKNKAEGPAPSNKEAAGTATEDPTPMRQSGGRIGEESAASLSRPARRRRRSTSRKPGDAE